MKKPILYAVLITLAMWFAQDPVDLQVEPLGADVTISGR